jgi:hypothetical protein
VFKGICVSGAILSIATHASGVINANLRSEKREFHFDTLKTTAKPCCSKVINKDLFTFPSFSSKHQNSQGENMDGKRLKWIKPVTLLRPWKLFIYINFMLDN